MKSTFSLFFVVLFTGFVSAQNVELSGQISGIADENLRVYLPADHFGQSWEKEIEVTSGHFSEKLNIPASGWLKLNYKGKDNRFFLWKGSAALDVNFDADFLDTDFSVNGSGAAIDSFVRGVDEKFGAKLSVKWLEEQAKDASNIDAMEMETFRLRNDVVFRLKEMESTLPSEFSKAYKNHLGYFYYLSLFKFSEAKSKSSNIPKATEIPKVLLEGLSWDRMNDFSELDSDFFRELLLSFVRYQALSEYDFMKFATKQAGVQEEFNLARTNLKGEALEYYLVKTMLSNSQTVQPSLLRQMNSLLEKTENASAFSALIADSLGARLQAKDDEVEIAVNDPVKDHNAIDIDLDGLNGKKFKLSELKGKVVYLDIWASWCGPCRKMFPYAKKMHDELSKSERKKIEFLYISIDNTETKWKEALENFDLQGKQGFSPGGWGSDVTRVFKISSIPRYLIFNKKGELVDHNAPRPANPETIKILRSLL